ncbi:hypothetical protein OIV83_005090 [Microbotryomycetes sp. JL201]|nr:hypothetical protein OIV83_005090 [Microbotryomycetes sp. JL201]
MPPAAHNVNWNPPAVLSRLVQPGFVDAPSTVDTAKSRASGLRSAAHKLDLSSQDGPLSNWEIAYVYGYLTRFTEWRTLDGPLPDVSVLEQELVNSSPPEGSRLIKTPPPPRGSNNHYIMPWQLAEDDEVFATGLTTTINTPTIAGDNDEEMRLPPLPSDAATGAAASHANGNDSAGPGTPGADDGDGILEPSAENLPTWSTLSWGKLTEEDLSAEGGIPPSSQLLIEIIKSLEKHLYLPEFEQSHGRRDWFSWLVRFTNKRLYTFGRGGFRWTHNLLKRVGVKSGSEREQEFWLLRWEDKIHLIRQMIDFTLANVKHVRKAIDDSYDLGKQRVSKRGDSNELMIECLGKVKNSWVWKIDDSPRLYASSDPYASADIRDVDAEEFEWSTIATNVDGYMRFVESLPKPDWSLIEARMYKIAEEEALEAAGFNPDGTPLNPPAASGSSKGGKPAKKKQKTQAGTDSGPLSSKASTPATAPKVEVELNPATGRPDVTIAQALVPHGKKTKGQKLWEEQSPEAQTRARLEEELPLVLEFQKATRGQRPQRNVKQPDYTYPGLQLDDGAWITSSGRTSRRSRLADAESGGATGYAEDGSVGEEEWKGERRSSRIHHRREGGIAPSLDPESDQALTPMEGVEDARPSIGDAKSVEGEDVKAESIENGQADEITQAETLGMDGKKEAMELDVPDEQASPAESIEKLAEPIPDQA